MEAYLVAILAHRSKYPDNEVSVFRSRDVMYHSRYIIAVQFFRRARRACVGLHFET